MLIEARSKLKFADSFVPSGLFLRRSSLLTSSSKRKAVEIVGVCCYLWVRLEVQVRPQQAAFSLLNLTWIWGAFFGAIVGFGRAYMPEDAVFNMNVWVKELHGPNGSAPCGPWVLGLVSWLRETYHHVFVAVC